ncbi:hypothetical protein [Snodgrassella sp. ESL0324]|uniref:hypothetical protein n=1 Tax=Snodgrassella sp. ESL0324 TaxID=2705033 RepID=UPI0015819DEB|nr:hypothetical protein [Snodgrassella sp. ESL0324]NUF08060.1 hypothetical protein [Snodgrassella sp. ESL0324]
MAKNPSNTSSDAPKKRGRPPKSTDNEDTLLQVNNSVDEQTKGSKADNTDVVPPEVDEADNTDAVPPEVDEADNTDAVPPEVDGADNTDAVPPEVDEADNTDAVPPEVDGADNTDAVPPEVDEADNTDVVPQKGTKTKTIKEVFISNISPTSYVIPQLNIEMRPGEMDVSASVSKDTLTQIRNNADTFNAVNGWDGKTLGIIVDVHKG